MKTCPLKTNQYGHAQWCGEKECAWWDVVNSQCSAKTFFLQKSLIKNLNDNIAPAYWEE